MRLLLFFIISNTKTTTKLCKFSMAAIAGMDMMSMSSNYDSHLQQFQNICTNDLSTEKEKQLERASRKEDLPYLTADGQ